ncbi:epidermal growth factor receptor kinase substrate 8-like protein 3b isoform X2 [Pseudorasbora parva]|uniref:epidermal growth factor receptor kinase substrate 8-like protein 3b isoform X2 n=1 Tax=Pseudorasbora parva TaxID=51549 RepID=UPI00351E398E
MYGGNPVPVFQPRGFSSEPSSQGSGMSRPSAKSIYMQRKEYAESVSRQDNFQYRVEHLFTFVLDGREVSSIDDCVNKLKNMDSKGKVWGQDMIIQIQANHLQLCDIETKEVLESVHLNSIRKTRAVLDSCVYDSLLIISVQDPSQRAPQAFLFQCEEAGAQEVVNDLERAIQHGGDAPLPFREPQMDIRSHLESILGQGYPGSMKRPALSPMQSNPLPPESPPPQFNNYEDYDDRRLSPTMPILRDEAPYRPMQSEPEQGPPPVNDVDRDAEIFNHVAADIETFTYKIGSALPKNDGSKKKKKKDSPKLVASIPTVDEYISCLQKIKYGFNLLGKLDGHLKNPPASDFIHSLFSSLAFMASQYPPNIPPTVLSPLLTEKALQLLGSVVTPDEDRLWGSLGDAWNVPRSKFPNGNQIPPYYPQFYDGWQPLPPGPSLSPPASRQLSRSNSERFPSSNVNQRPHDQDIRPWSTPPTQSAEPPLSMRVIYDFMARNSQELSLMKGDMVQVTDKSGQWWKVKNSRGEEGYVPQNVLEPLDGQKPPNMRGPPSLDMKSRPEEVKAWLQYKGFSKMTVQSLGVFNGAMLLAMKQEDIRGICPEEGGRVFFQLQSVRSTIALASESEYNQYGGRR